MSHANEHEHSLALVQSPLHASRHFALNGLSHDELRDIVAVARVRVRAAKTIPGGADTQATAARLASSGDVAAEARGCGGHAVRDWPSMARARWMMLAAVHGACCAALVANLRLLTARIHAEARHV